jgi:hypothetical protein
VTLWASSVNHMSPFGPSAIARKPAPALMPALKGLTAPVVVVRMIWLSGRSTYPLRPLGLEVSHFWIWAARYSPMAPGG